MKLFISVLIQLMLWGHFSPVHADVRLPKIFGPGVVLQRDTVVNIWGWADPKEKVTVQLLGREFKTKANNQGSWSLEIGPYEAGGPYDLIVSGNNNITIPNVLFGEVWLCSGQSNMQFTLRMIGKSPSEIFGVDNDRIRLFQVELTTDYLPGEDFKGGNWKSASLESVADFSATAYFFGKNLYDSLGVPIGLISSNLGATSIETWDGYKNSS